MARRRGKLRGYKKMRSTAYRVARTMGNAQPYLELDVRKIIRRFVHRKVGKAFAKTFYGKGAPARLLKRVLGL